MKQLNTRVEKTDAMTGTHIYLFPQQPNTVSTPVDVTDTIPNLFGVPLPNIEHANMEQLTALIQQVVQATVHEMRATITPNDDDDWSLTDEQAFFMLTHANLIEAAFAGVEDENEYTQSLHDLANSDEFAELFGDMSFDEAYDRYTTMLEEGRA